MSRKKSIQNILTLSILLLAGGSASSYASSSDFTERQRIKTILKEEKSVLNIPNLTSEKDARFFFEKFIKHEEGFWKYQIRDLVKDVNRKEYELFTKISCTYKDPENILNAFQKKFQKNDEIEGIFNRLLRITKIIDSIDDVQSPNSCKVPVLSDLLQKSENKEDFFAQGNKYYSNEFSKNNSKLLLEHHTFTKQAYETLEGYVKILEFFKKIGTYFHKDFDHLKFIESLTPTKQSQNLFKNQLSPFTLSPTKSAKTLKPSSPRNKDVAPIFCKESTPTFENFALFMKRQAGYLEARATCMSTSCVPEIQRYLDEQLFLDVRDHKELVTFYTNILDAADAQLKDNLLKQLEKERAAALRFFEEDEEKKSTKKKNERAKKQGKSSLLKIKKKEVATPALVLEVNNPEEESILSLTQSFPKDLPVSEEKAQAFSEQETVEISKKETPASELGREEINDLTPWKQFDGNAKKNKKNGPLNCNVAQQEMPGEKSDLSENNKDTLLALFSTEPKYAQSNVTMQAFLSLLEHFKGDVSRNGCNLKFQAGDSGVIFMHVLHKDKSKIIPRNTYYWKQAKFLLLQVNANEYLKGDIELKK
ncbi:MAG TPA: hypothetical protein VI959_01025 [Alphaproteobacteria bacterium]|nr:hypothetical protein [Alphaproteobacteria bacterium]